MSEPEKLPPKIAYLYQLKNKGFVVPDFFVLDKVKIENIKTEIEKIRLFLRQKNIKNIIIRSASSSEDQKNKSLAGFFESSGSIAANDLRIIDIEKIWSLNYLKLTEIKNQTPLYLFIQQFQEFDYSGVLFTQNIYDDQKATLNLAQEEFGITSGKSAQQNITYEKKSKKWFGANRVISEKIKKELEKLIYSLSDIFPEGADVELGIKNDKLFLLQARPITRSKDEKILLLEKKRLASLFDKDFQKQIWTQNNFTDALGNLSCQSVNFYNKLLCSRELNELLLESGFSDKRKPPEKILRLLENIGERTYINLSLWQEVFPTNKSFLKALRRLIRIKTYEKLIRKKSKEIKKKVNIDITTAFCWLFLSGAYFQFFLEQDKTRYKNDFTQRLRNTEMLTGATQPFFKEDQDLKNFYDEFYYLSDQPYELRSPRITSLNKKELLLKFKNSAKTKEPDQNKTLSTSASFWLKEKSYWKKIFLKSLTEKQKKLVKKCGPGFLTSYLTNENKISNKYLEINGANFPFPKEKGSCSDIIIVPGEISPEKLCFLDETKDITQYLGKYIAIDKFPNSWIPFIPKLGGIITKEGNELSHTAITCREYQIPYLISKKYFIAKPH